MSQLQVTGEAKIRAIQGPVVANSGVVTALDGDASQYVRGDGTLADFPTSTGGGSSVSYYLNSSVSQGTIGGVAYRQLSKTPIIGAGTDITISANGYVASYLTDANDPSLLEVPAGNFNCEFYFSVNSDAHNPYVYAEVYKYDGTTFTLLGTSVGVPEYLSNGTTLSPYYFAIPVATSVLTITDRISIRIYVNVDGRTVTLHTENGHLCQVVTTFSKGLISLNNLTRQNQFFGTGTSGTDFNISSTTATHTFNLPVASAANTGKLSSTDWSTFNGKVPYTGATSDVDLGVYGLTASLLRASESFGSSGSLILSTGTTSYNSGTNAITLVSSPTVANTLIIQSDVSSVVKIARIGLGSLTATRTFTLPDISGTLALLEGTQTFTGAKTFNNSVKNEYGTFIKENQKDAVPSGYKGLFATTNGLEYENTNTSSAFLNFNNAGNYTYTFPSASGTIALTSNLSSYVPYSGATTNVTLGTNTLTASTLIVDQGTTGTTLRFKQYGSASYNTNGYTDIFAVSNNIVGFGLNQGSGNFKGFTFNVVDVTLNQSRDLYIPNASGTLALTSDLGAYVTLATAQDISGNKTFTSLSTKVEGLGLKLTTGVVSTGGYLTLNTKVVGTLHSLILAPDSATNRAEFTFDNTAIRTYALPNASGTIALTSNLSAYLPLAGGTLTGALSGTSATFSGNLVVNTGTGATFRAIYDSDNITEIGNFSSASGYRQLNIVASTINLSTGTAGGSSATNRLTIASTGAATFSSSVTATQFIIGGTPSNTAGFTNSFYAEGSFPSLTLKNTTSPASSFTLGLSSGGAFGIWNNTTNTYPIYVNSSDNVGIGTTTPNIAKFEVKSPFPTMFTADSAVVSPTYGGSVFYRTTNRVGDGNGFVFNFDDSVGSRSEYAYIGSVIETNTNGSQSGSIIFAPFRNGGRNQVMSLSSVGQLVVGGTGNVLIDYSSNVSRFYGGSGTNTFGLGAGSTIYYQGDNSQFYPTADNARSIGLGSNRYTAIWAVNGTIQTSDEREKTDIVNSDLGLDFVTKLRPVSYKWKVGQNNQTTETTIDEEGNEKIESTITPRAGIRTHYGLIAQEVEELLNGKDFGGFIHDKESDVKGLRYDQFVPLLIKAIQEQQAQIEELKALIAAK